MISSRNRCMKWDSVRYPELLGAQTPNNVPSLQTHFQDTQRC